MPQTSFTASSLACLSESQRSKKLSQFTEAELAALNFHWPFWARPDQLPPESDWTYWLLLGGRGAGKTRTGAEMVREWAQIPKRRIALVAPTAADARDTMVEGISGIQSVCPPWDMPNWEPSKRRLTWANGSIATTFSADEPERLRGPNHHFFWADEVCAWRRLVETWDMLQFGFRLGDDPQGVVTTTPKPVKWLIDILKDPEAVITKASTYANRANLSPKFFRKIITKYEGTRLGQQELEAKVLEEAEGALWTRKLIEKARIKPGEIPNLSRIVIGIDPAVSQNEQSNETGIVAAGRTNDGHAYVLHDLSGTYSPNGWAQKAITHYQSLKADRIIGEVNNGGDMVGSTVRTCRDEDDKPIGKNVSFKKVHASKGKAARAEPISALYEQGRVHHVGAHSELEDQMCTWEPLSNLKSPDRLDAAVWALTELMINEPKKRTAGGSPETV